MLSQGISTKLLKFKQFQDYWDYCRPQECMHMCAHTHTHKIQYQNLMKMRHKYKENNNRHKQIAH